jgi:hypothetical protein
MEDNKTFNNRMNIKYFEEEYSTQKMIFLIENPEKTERNFIESKIEQFNQLELEYKRKCDLSDDEVYQEIKKTGIVANYISRGFDKTNKKDFEADLENRFLKFRQRYIFKEKSEEGIRSIFYKTKLKNLSNTETIISSEIFKEIDLSNTSAVQKIIYLNELGIIELLKKEPCFKASVNNLATVLSAITGENIKTLQPILNPMFNKNTAQKNNPYSSKLTVEKVKSQLINLGIQSK